MAEIGIAIAAKRIRVEKALKKRKAFDEALAVNPEEAGIDYKRILKLMDEGGLINRTQEGKIYLTGKGRKKAIDSSS